MTLPLVRAAAFSRRIDSKRAASHARAISSKRVYIARILRLRFDSWLCSLVWENKANILCQVEMAPKAIQDKQGARHHDDGVFFCFFISSPMSLFQPFLQTHLACFDGQRQCQYPKTRAKHGIPCFHKRLAWRHICFSM